MAGFPRGIGFSRVGHRISPPGITTLRGSVSFWGRKTYTDNFSENSNDARTVTVFYTASLAQVVGPSYKAPNLAILAQQWLQAKGTFLYLRTNHTLGLTRYLAPELRNASRLRFEAGIVRLLDEEVVQLVENWQNGCASSYLLHSLRKSNFDSSTIPSRGSVQRLHPKCNVALHLWHSRNREIYVVANRVR